MQLRERHDAPVQRQDPVHPEVEARDVVGQIDAQTFRRAACWRSGVMVAGAASAPSKKARVVSCVITAMPSAAKAWSPPE
jgi:hypothetical protein